MSGLYIFIVVLREVAGHFNRVLVGVVRNSLSLTSRPVVCLFMFIANTYSSQAMNCNFVDSFSYFLFIQVFMFVF